MYIMSVGQFRVRAAINFDGMYIRSGNRMTIIEGEIFFDRAETDTAATWVLDQDSGEEGQ